MPPDPERPPGTTWKERGPTPPNGLCHRPLVGRVPATDTITGAGQEHAGDSFIRAVQKRAAMGVRVDNLLGRNWADLTHQTWRSIS